MRVVLDLIKQDCINRSSVETRYSEAYIEKVAAAEAAVDHLVTVFESVSPAEAAGAISALFPKKFKAEELKVIKNAVAALQAIAPVSSTASPVAEEPVEA